MCCLFLFAALLLRPQAASAHGALLIRIADVTRQIDAATNHLANLYLERGELYRQDENWAAAWEDYDHAQRLDPRLPGVDLCRANLLAASGKLPDAKAMFDKVLAAEHANAKAFIGRARVLAQLGQRDAAIPDYRQGLALDHLPEPEAYLELSHLLQDERREGESLDALDAGIKKFGPIPLLEVQAIHIELAAKRADAALDRIDRVMSREVRKEHWYSQRGDILLSIGRFSAARDAYQKSLGAIRVLPRRLQTSPPLQTLAAHINKALASMNDNTGGALTSASR